MALILGDEITHRDLVPVFDGFLKDLDEVKIGVLKHLADFLRVRSTFKTNILCSEAPLNTVCPFLTIFFNQWTYV